MQDNECEPSRHPKSKSFHGFATPPVAGVPVLSRPYIVVVRASDLECARTVRCRRSIALVVSIVQGYRLANQGEVKPADWCSRLNGAAGIVLSNVVMELSLDLDQLRRSLSHTVRGGQLQTLLPHGLC